MWDGFNFLVRLAGANDVRGLVDKLAAIERLPCAGVIVTALGDDDYDCVSRYFAPVKGIPEDPVSGGAHCALTPYWTERLSKVDLDAFWASARGGAVHCRMLGDRVQLEGACVFFMEGGSAMVSTCPVAAISVTFNYGRPRLRRSDDL